MLKPTRPGMSCGLPKRFERRVNTDLKLRAFVVKLSQKHSLRLTLKIEV